MGSPFQTKKEFLAALPEAFHRQIEKVEKYGWSGVNWGKNYTLLHWAAKHGRLDILKHCIATYNGSLGTLFKEDNHLSGMNAFESYKILNKLARY